jgi:hypothetical protein
MGRGTNGAVGAHRVGSVPLSDADEVFETAAEILGDRLERIPDGETGERTEWIHFQLPVLAATPGLEMQELELPPEVELPPGAPRTLQGFAIGEGKGPEDISFGDLGYADAAKSSYERFAELKAGGKIPEHVRFQVSLPTALAVMGWVLPHYRAGLDPRYQEALLREVGEIAAAIPHDQLAIQFDLCMEVLMIEGWPGMPPFFEDMWEGILSRVVAHATAVPADVELGFHFCYGDYKGERQVDPRNAANFVRLAHSILERVEHPVAWFHMPVPRELAAEQWIPPLADLRLPEGTRLYLGVIYGPDRGDEAAKIVDLAAGHCAVPFGVATECGMGRRPRDWVRPVMEIQRDIAAPAA